MNLCVCAKNAPPLPLPLLLPLPTITTTTALKMTLTHEIGTTVGHVAHGRFFLLVIEREIHMVPGKSYESSAKSCPRKCMQD